jgi:glycerol uptake facilitator-like aquaporin
LNLVSLQKTRLRYLRVAWASVCESTSSGSFQFLFFASSKLSWNSCSTAKPTKFCNGVVQTLYSAQLTVHATILTSNLLCLSTSMSHEMASTPEKRFPDQTLLPPSSHQDNMSATLIKTATDTDGPHRQHHLHLFDHNNNSCNRPLAGGLQFAGRVGGNQEFVVDRKDPKNALLLERMPDAAPYMTVHEQFEMRGFLELELWKAALMEGWGTMMVTYLTIWCSISPNIVPLPPDPRFGLFNNAAFIGPCVGAICNWLAITLFTFTFSPVTGAHLNPLISIATCCARLTSFPRMVLYVAFQTIGGALCGLLIRASYDSRDFKAGGCYLFEELVPVSNAFTIEFMACMIVLFLAFGVGLDPRQRAVFGPALAPVFVGGIVALLSLGTSFSRYGYGGASVNPARCFAVMVGSRFRGWHWVHWVGPLCASIVHGFFYLVLPPWTIGASKAGSGVDSNSA